MDYSAETVLENDTGFIFIILRHNHNQKITGTTFTKGDQSGTLNN